MDNNKPSIKGIPREKMFESLWKESQSQLRNIQSELEKITGKPTIGGSLNYLREKKYVTNYNPNSKTVH